MKQDTFTFECEVNFNRAEKEMGAIGHFIYSILKKSAEFGTKMVTSWDDEFYDQILGKKDGGPSDLFYVQCGLGAYMGLTRTNNDEKQIVRISFFLTKTSPSVDEALQVHFQRYIDEGREQFADLEIILPYDFFFSEGTPELRVANLKMNICLVTEMQTSPLDFDLFREKFRQTNRATETSQSGMDSIEHIIKYRLIPALSTSNEIVEVWGSPDPL